MSIHRLYAPNQWPPAGGELSIDGPEAEHAVRARRAEPGEAAELLDGAGRRATGVVMGIGGSRKHAALTVRVDAITAETPPTRRIEVCSAVPKGDALGEMIDQLSQLGAWSWRPLLCERSIVDPREAKIERLRRITVESAKQCGRAWFMRIDDAFTIEQAVTPAGVRLLVADATGESAAGAMAAGGSLRLLVGPEGGFTREEMDRCRGAGATVVRLGSHVLRIETAAVAAAAVFAALDDG